MREILIASDLTDASGPALRTALDLGRRLDARVTAVHVVAPAADAASEGVVRQEKHAAETVLGEQVRRAVDEPARVRVHIQLGTPAEGILDAASELGADMIVIGTHGRTGWQHLVLGSVAERVVRGSAIPVLTVRGK